MVKESSGDWKQCVLDAKNADKKGQVLVTQAFFTHYEDQNDNHFLNYIVAGDETWVSPTPENKQQSVQ